MAVQFVVAPCFDDIVLQNDQTVRDVLEEVIKARLLLVGCVFSLEERERICATITKETGCKLVRDLRQLRESEWRSLRVPAVCRIYMKYAVRQAGGDPNQISETNNTAKTTTTTTTTASQTVVSKSMQPGSCDNDTSYSPETECVVCLCQKKTHVVLNCMHLCLCEVCASLKEFQKHDARCPICNERVGGYLRIYT